MINVTKYKFLFLATVISTFILSYTLLGWLGVLVTLLPVLLIERKKKSDKDKFLYTFGISALMITVILSIYLWVQNTAPTPNIYQPNTTTIQVPLFIEECYDKAYLDYVDDWNAACKVDPNPEIDHRSESPFFCYLPNYAKSIVDSRYENSRLKCQN